MDALNFSTCTSEGFTVSSITCRAVIQCENPEGALVVPGIVVGSNDSSLDYKSIDPRLTLSVEGLKAVAGIMQAMEEEAAKAKQKEWMGNNEF